MNPNQLDQDVVNMAKAIRSVETQGQADPFTARGGSGEFGAYQFTKPTWEKASQETFGQVVPLEGATKEQQNQVAYQQIKKMKDAGYNIGQVASVWNSGKPDAYLDPKYTGVNDYGVRYDVPKYARSVAEAYKSIKGSGEPTVTPISPSTIGHEQYGTPDSQQPQKGFLGTKQNDSLYGKLIDNSITRGIQNFFPGKKLGEAIGTLGGYGFNKIKDAVTGENTSQFYDLSAPSPLQATGDAASALLFAGTGLAGKASTAGKALLGTAKAGKALNVFGKSVPLLKPGATGLARIAQATGIGAGFGGAGALAEGKTDVKGILKDTAIGAATGGVLGTGAEALTKIAHVLPRRIAGSFIKTPANEDVVDYAVKKGLGSPRTMLQQSDTSIKTLGKQLDTALKNPKYANVKFKGKDILDDILAQFPDAGMNRADLISNLKRIAPLKAATIQKLSKGSFTIKELHSLNSAIGKNTYKMAFDDPTVKAGKELGNAVYHRISSIIKGTAKETVPLFDDLSREFPLNEALDRAIKRGVKAKNFTFMDLAAIIGGMHIAGPVGGLGVLTGEKILRSPTVNLKGAGILSKFASPGAAQLRQGVRAPLIDSATGLVGKLRGE
jgi:hypothetical protein